MDRIEHAAREIVPSRRAASVLAGELAVFWYAFASWRRTPEVRVGATAFTIHKQSGVAMLFGFLAGVSCMEAAVVHVVVARWSATAAWLLTAVSTYGAIWLTAVARSFALRPIVIEGDHLLLRAGLLWTIRVPLDRVRVSASSAGHDLKLPPLAEPNLFLQLDEPVEARGLYGMRRCVRTIGLAFDDPAAFRSVLNW